MSDEPICKICGHRGNAHRFDEPIVCVHCLGMVCHDGEAGQRYRASMRDGYNEALNSRVPGPVDTSQPTLSVKKYGSTIQVSDDMAMEYGLIPDTRPPVHYSRRLRFRWWRQRKVDDLRMRVGSWIAGVNLADHDDY